MRAFFDTNVLVAAFITKGVCFRLMRSAVRGTPKGVTSETVLDEFARVLRTRFGITDTQVGADVEEIRRDFQILATPAHVPAVCRDPSDDPILAAAVAARADVLVTGDQDLLTLGRHEGVEILTPAALFGRVAVQSLS